MRKLEDLVRSLFHISQVLVVASFDPITEAWDVKDFAWIRLIPLILIACDAKQVLVKGLLRALSSFIIQGSFHFIFSLSRVPLGPLVALKLLLIEAQFADAGVNTFHFISDRFIVILRFFP